jgi:hypothetical protein
MASSKRQTTMAKIAREQAVREKRARKAEKKEDKKQAAADALLAPPEGSELGLEAEGGDEAGATAEHDDDRDAEPNRDAVDAISPGPSAA